MVVLSVLYTAFNDSFLIFNMSNWTRQRYNKQFAQFLTGLNARQRAAVDQLEGPTLVLAGPGTGKTHLLSARVGSILLQTDTQAHSILCLTFTEAGVQAMRQRLLQLIGPEAHRLPIFTFHSFCNSIIQDNLEYFGHQDLVPLSDLERVDIIRELLAGLAHDHPLRRTRANPYFYELSLRALFQTMKAEDWSPDWIWGRVRLYLEGLPQRPEFQYRVNRGTIRKGDPKTALLETEARRMALLEAASALFPIYEGLLRQRRRYDYEDMILWVIRAFERESLLLRTYQERFLYLVVDEFQDTNGAQNQLLLQLADFWESPNLFIVGDDDQSIFEFQGARLRNLLDIRDRFRTDMQLIFLEENYRSSQRILNAASQLIQRNEHRLSNELATDKRLLARHPVFATARQPPQVRAYPNPEQEMGAVLTQLRDWKAAGIPYEEMAVIYARHRQVERLTELLEKEQLPYQSKRQINVLDRPLVRQLREILQYLALEGQRPGSGEYLFFRILHFRFLGLETLDLARLSLAKQRLVTPVSWREWLSMRKAWPTTVQNAERIAWVSQWFEQQLACQQERPLLRYVEEVLNGSGLLRNTLNSADRSVQLQLLQSFMAFLRSEIARRPRLHLSGFLETLQRMDENGLPVALQRSLGSESGVTLVTAHSAKGLEFRAVVILDARQKEWDPGRSYGGTRFRFPDTVTLSGSEDELEARRRLFFVAMTRAKEQLLITYSQQNEQGKPQQRSQFVDELLEEKAVDFVSVEIPTEQLGQLHQLSLERHPPQLQQRLDTSLINDRLQYFRMSVSALHRYLRCPLEFFFEVLLQAPHIQSEAATYGTALHHSLQWLFDQMMLDPERQFPEESEVLAHFERELEKLRAYFTPDQWRARLEQGRANLARYYQQQLPTWPRRVQTEVQLRQVEVEGVPLTGVIDRVDFLEGDRVRLLDYKTGSHSDQKWRKPTEARPNGGSYWRQLLFYKLLYENQRVLPGRVVEGTIAYLDPDAEGQFPERSNTFSADEVAYVRQLIVDTYAKIQRHEFYEGCGKPDCIWCRFATEDLEWTLVSNQEVEELDD